MFSSDDILKKINPKDVENQIYEIKVSCEKFSKSSSMAGTKAYKIKRPFQGTMTISMFCMYCERNYKLYIMSDQVQTNKKSRSLGWFILLVIGLYFYVDLERLWMFLILPLYYLRLKMNIPFVESSIRHETRVIREFEPIGVNFKWVNNYYLLNFHFSKNRKNQYSNLKSYWKILLVNNSFVALFNIKFWGFHQKCFL